MRLAKRMGDWAVTQPRVWAREPRCWSSYTVTVDLAGSPGGPSVGHRLKSVTAGLHGREAGTRSLLEQKVKLLITVYIGNG